MGRTGGFLSIPKCDWSCESPKSRIKHWSEFTKIKANYKTCEQAARCMDCGIPFCQSACPVHNFIPKWNDLVSHKQWEDAFWFLRATNNFPEFTGRVCPAPCEHSCVLSINDQNITIKNIEVAIIEYAYKNRIIQARLPRRRSAYKVAIIGSGPAGLACADELNQDGHHVHVFEKNESPGGLLRFGIPDFKLEKYIVDRRISLMREEGIEFFTSTSVDEGNIDEILEKYDAIVLCCGAESPRDLAVPGREYKGIYFAMDFLSQQNRANARLPFSQNRIHAKDKRVVILGGGDTGSDCLGTSIRQGARSINNYELMSRPPKNRAKNNPWPEWKKTERASSSHQEGGKRDYGILTTHFSSTQGEKVDQIHGVRVQFGAPDPITGKQEMKQIPGSQFSESVDLVFLALGFLGPTLPSFIDDLGIKHNKNGLIATDENKMTNYHGIFAAGDICRGQSLVVWAIEEGRKAAKGVRHYLAKLKN